MNTPAGDRLFAACSGIAGPLALGSSAMVQPTSCVTSVLSHGVTHGTWGPRVWHLSAAAPVVCCAVSKTLSCLHLASKETSQIDSLPSPIRLGFFPDKSILKDPPKNGLNSNHLKIVYRQSIINNGTYFK